MVQPANITGVLPWGPGPAGEIQACFETLFRNGLHLTELAGELLNSGAAVTFTSPDTPYSFSHNLNRVPTGFIIVAQSRFGGVRGLPDGTADDQGTAWTSTTITLVAAFGGTKAIIFVF